VFDRTGALVFGQSNESCITEAMATYEPLLKLNTSELKDRFTPPMTFPDNTCCFYCLIILLVGVYD
jgi:hypothetical protein